jgi:hypothetical protein
MYAALTKVLLGGLVTVLWNWLVSTLSMGYGTSSSNPPGLARRSKGRRRSVRFGCPAPSAGG